MKKPKMIMFDYGQTLVDEGKFDGVKGTQAVLEHAKVNKYGATAEAVQAFADEVNFEIGRTDTQRRDGFIVEVPNHMFTAYIYQSMGIELSLTPKEIDEVFWEAATDGRPTDGIAEFLDYLKCSNIRTAVVSNISYCGDALKERIRRMIPSHDFEFIIATSEYMFRKPNKRIFQFALDMAALQPEDVWFVGDNYKCDVLGALSVGMTAILYCGTGEPQCEKSSNFLGIKNWRDLKAILEKLQ